MPKQKQEHCLATVTSPDFIVGTLIMLNSFLRHNRWFKGDIIIIHDQLPEKFRGFFNFYKNIKFQQISNSVKQKVINLSEKLPHLNLQKKIPRFYSLEIFHLFSHNYEVLLFCDSDILFLNNIQELFNLKDNLYCCGDKYYYTQSTINTKTYTPIENSASSQNDQDTLYSTFNSGFMLFSKELMSDTLIQDILELLDTKVWSNIQAPFTDQIIFNLYFKDRHIILDPKYNYLVSHRDMINTRKNISSKDLKVLHFNGKTKPWDHFQVLEATSNDTTSLAFFQLWHKAYLDFLPEINLRYMASNNYRKI